MLADVRGGLRMARHRWVTVVGLAGMITVAAAVLAIVLGDVLSQMAVMRGGSELRRHDAVSFTPFYLESEVSDVEAPALMLLADAITRDEAYTSVVGNVEIDNPDFADGRRTIIIVGDAPGTLLPDLHLCSPAPCAMRGAHLRNDEIGPIEFAGHNWDPDEVLPPSATFFDPNSAGLILDDVVVLHANASDIEQFDDYEREEALTKAILLRPSESLTASYVSATAAGGLFLVPHDLNADQPRRFRDLMIRSAMYIVGLAAFLTLVLSAFTAVADAALRQESRGLEIRRVYGARPWHVAVRIATFLAATVVVVPVPILLALRLVGRPVTDGANLALVLVLAVYGGLWATMMRRQFGRDPIDR